MKQKIKQLAGIFVLGVILYIGARSMNVFDIPGLPESAQYALDSTIDAVRFIILYYFAYLVYCHLKENRTQRWAALLLCILPIIMLIEVSVSNALYAIAPLISETVAFVLPLLLMKQPKYVKFGILATIALYFVFMIVYGNEHLDIFIRTFMM